MLTEATLILTSLASYSNKLNFTENAATGETKLLSRTVNEKVIFPSLRLGFGMTMLPDNGTDVMFVFRVIQLAKERRFQLYVIQLTL